MVMDGGSVLVGSTGPSNQQASNSGSTTVNSQVGQTVVSQLSDGNSNNGQSNQINQNQAGGQNPDAMRVAREFVRQYYTIMHESPIHLHRFYNDESDFIHGGIGASQGAKAVRGQHEIHRTIMNLNFRDCYAKILYVDAQESVNQSVVVQVAGELSNQGNPMRRFLQTFVLVPIMARKYYVRNDIFRYQDEIFEDPTDGEEDIGVEQRGSTPITVAVSTPSAPISTVTSQHSQTNSTQATSLMNGQVQDQPSGNANVHEHNGLEDIKEKTDEKRAKEWSPPVQQHIVSNSGLSEDTSQVSLQTNSSTASQVPPASQSSQANQPQPKSWSQMVQNKSEPPVTASLSQPSNVAPTFVGSTSFGGNLGSGPVSNSAGLSQRAPRTVSLSNRQQNGTTLPGSLASNNNNNNNSNVSSNSNNSNSNNINNTSSVTSAPLAIKKDVKPVLSNVNNDEAQGDMNNVTQNPFTPDNQQLFVGNIPIQVSDKQLKDFFSSYGSVQDFRLSTNKASGNGKGPNYGFVVFDSPETVQKVLQNRPIYWDSENKLRLNVEEKKPRSHKTGGGTGGNRGNTMGRPRPPMINGRNTGYNNVPRGSGDRVRQAGSGGPRTAIQQH